MSASTNFRRIFKLISKEPINWFPGHMNKGLKQMQRHLRNMDCIIEVHDARIPISGRNIEFQRSITGNGIKPHILVLNKKDLTNPNDYRDVRQQLKYENQNTEVIFTNCKQQTCQGVQRILPLATQLISKAERYNRTSSKEFNIMIIGVPNVGKSSLINVLRHKHMKKKSAAKVGALPGVTISVGERIKIQDKPAIYMYDSPGILQPRIDSDETGMKLALVGCIPDHIVGEELIADYLIYWLNKHKRFEYVKLLGLEEPSDDIIKVLGTYANQAQIYHRIKNMNGTTEIVVDIIAAAKKVISFFRTGQLGALNLDEK